MSFMENIFKNVHEVQKFAPGALIFEQGTFGSCMYLVKEGEVDVLVDGKPIDSCGPGTSLGELALIDKQPHTGTAVAKTACELLPIDQKRFLHLVQETPYFALHIMELLVERLRLERQTKSG